MESQSKIRILVADDDHLNRSLLYIQLRKYGYEVDVAENGLEVLRVHECNSYNFILMDCIMPLIDGTETVKEIRRREGNSNHTIIIAVTASDPCITREQCLNAGMDDFISKPISLSELRTILESWTTKLISP